MTSLQVAFLARHGPAALEGLLAMSPRDLNRTLLWICLVHCSTHPLFNKLLHSRHCLLPTLIEAFSAIALFRLDDEDESTVRLSSGQLGAHC